MFEKIKFREFITLKPRETKEELYEFCKREFSTRLRNKILRNIGLCIEVLDVTILEGIVLPFTGNVQLETEVLCLVFCSFPGEILTGKIINNQNDGVVLSLGFCLAKVEENALMKGFTFDSEEEVWRFEFEGKNYYCDDGSIANFKTSSLFYSKEFLGTENTPPVYLLGVRITFLKSILWRKEAVDRLVCVLVGLVCLKRVVLVETGKNGRNGTRPSCLVEINKEKRSNFRLICDAFNQKMVEDEKNH